MKKQFVALYHNIEEAYESIQDAIEKGLKVHTCVSGNSSIEYEMRILVIYEKELETWNWGD